MRANWSAAPLWLRALCVLGVPWCAAFVVVGAPLLLTEGPGLPLIWLGMLGLAPWFVLARRSRPDDVPRESGDNRSR